MNIVPAVLLLLVVSSTAVLAKEYDWVAGNTSVWICAATYCDTNSYLSRTYKGASKGFVPMYSINEKSYDTQGVVGVMPSQSTIYVAYRGSTSIQDWLDNLDDLKTSYPYCDNCEVHKGFYKTEQAQYPLVKSYVADLLLKYPTYKVIISGHSLGAALSTLVAMDLVADKTVPASSIRVFNFGSPRIGNDEFAYYTSKTLLDHNRNTHHKDIVPHVPMHERFTHIDGEWYQNGDGPSVPQQECVGYEDKNCSYQWNFTSIEDHMWYLNQYMGCDAVSV